MRRVPGIIAGSAALVAVAALVGGCNEDGPGDTGRFCGEVQEHAAELLAGPETPADIAGYLALYRRIADVAPLAIEAHWDALVLSVETASTVVPSDPESVQRAYARAFQTERSAVAVHDFLLANCDVDLGPITTIVAHSPATAPPESVPETTVAAGD